MKNLLRYAHCVWLRIMACKARKFLPDRHLLIVAPHPDDEIIGCGGLIAHLAKENKTPHVVIMTGGEGSHHGCCDTSSGDIVAARRRLTRNAAAIVGLPIENIHELNYPDGGISMNNAETDRLKALIDELQPDTILVPHWGEGWSDHIQTAEIVKLVAPRSAKLWMYCVWMWYYNVWRGLDWKNAVQLCMTPAEHRTKLAAMDAYIRPLASCGKPWSGVLPKVFVKANKWNRELYFEVNSLK
ncbi:PIG-L family deacetylase [Parabacteroides distasonis]|jgi:LmbE family N-acetylglucosaminyl deacetylase|uniref:PIG-L deacetylase family protein n=1 Tax=Parabacteroides distasonis TaxID=823 RepID=UPI00232F37DA|nr:PIG-L deacetylase family protein [Parabacteroides distasonis]MDB9003258.1 PIG-L family deacetylase [Parabacteroides distasonis]MDB9019968.1 PIG-L family deacetylase [Parabacteroides distasonis]MDB9057707.1 PIG-L family deacetylase [Parabacteroides distasonis]